MSILDSRASRRLVCCLVVGIALAACSKRDAGAPGAAVASPPDGGAGATDAGESAEDEVRPVYPTAGVAADPIAARFCATVHALPEARRATCCHQAPGLVFKDECDRTLSSALASKAVTLDAADVDRCAAAVASTYDGCDWVGPFAPALPAACQGIVRGALAKGARCRSTLECAGSLRCAGVGPTRAGRCEPPRADGERCGGSADTLVANTRQSEVDDVHAECTGFCDRFRCAPLTATGASCTEDVQCGRAGQCVAGRCAMRAAAASRKAGGSACQNDFECVGGCLRRDGGAPGICGMKCSVR